MTRTEIVSQFKQMPRREQLALLKALARVVEKPQTERKRTLHKLYGALSMEMIASPKETPRQRAMRLASLPTAQEMTGVIRAGNRAPTDEEVKQMYIDHLVEKYS